VPINLQDPKLAWTINALFRKANDLVNEAQMLFAAMPHQPDPPLFQAEGAAAQQEGYYCSAKAHALLAGGQYTYPGDAVIQQVAANCQTLEKAIATSAGWTQVIAAGKALIQSMPANSV
jgi:hypothetical protein